MGSAVGKVLTEIGLAILIAATWLLSPCLMHGDCTHFVIFDDRERTFLGVSWRRYAIVARIRGFVATRQSPPPNRSKELCAVC